MDEFIIMMTKVNEQIKRNGVFEPMSKGKEERQDSKLPEAIANVTFDYDGEEVFIDYVCVACGCLDPVPDFIVEECSYELKHEERTLNEISGHSRVTSRTSLIGCMWHKYPMLEIVLVLCYVKVQRTYQIGIEKIRYLICAVNGVKPSDNFAYRKGTLGAINRGFCHTISK